MIDFDPIGYMDDMFGLGLLRWVRERYVRQKLLIEFGLGFSLRYGGGSTEGGRSGRPKTERGRGTGKPGQGKGQGQRGEERAANYVARVDKDWPTLVAWHLTPLEVCFVGDRPV